ncbi:alpha-L-fucosidase [Longispora fulva]|uniref:alpha-L-fucosidase n=3 Tax=Longispora fulva TaxID=619741 RepID=A0A8J7G639_9ACTN|nr:alpha-L-fucosidase [Longispora fulva]MBG6134373.1 alpha-L-fucosidase [Longispora fulva]
MKRRFLAVAACALTVAVAAPAHAAVTPAPVIATPSSDTLAQRIEKAANVVPSAAQLAWQKREQTAFIHFGPNTFNGVEWGDGHENPNVVNPTNLDTDQWASTLKNAGFAQVTFTAKHHDGFLMYPTRYSDHSIKASSWRNGTGDIVRSFADSAHKYGLKVGFYLSPADLHEALAGGRYGNNSAARAATIPEVGLDGTRPSGPATFDVVADDYNRFFMNTLYELLTQYGQVDEVWFDGANPLGSTTQTYDYTDWVRIVRTLQPGAVMFGGTDLRWVGNEDGVARLSEYGALPFTGSATGAADRPTSPIGGEATDLGDAKLGAADFLKWAPAECDARIQPGWFWKAGNGPKTLNQLKDLYHTSIGRNCVLLLNTAPDNTGRLPADVVTRLGEFGDWIRSYYGTDAARTGTATSTDGGTAANATDGAYDTAWSPTTTTGTLTVDLGSPTTVGEFGVQENIAAGQRVTSFAVDTWNGTAWVQATTATTVGYRRLLKLANPITTSKVRLRILAARAVPAISSFSAYAGDQVTNLAYGRPATQSTTAWGGDAGRAVDGNTNGSWGAGSITHTSDPATEANPWWQVDLGSSRPLGTVNIFNRTDCCSNRLTDYWVFASDTPFTTSKTPTQQAATAGVWSVHQTTQAGAPTTIPVGRSARYLMVQQAGSQILSLAEFEAYEPTALTNGVYTVTSVGSAKNLDNPGGTTTGTQLVQWTQHSGTNQQWRFTGNADGTYTITNVASGLCVDVYGGSTSAGAAVIQWTCTNGANQRWRVTGGTIMAVHSSLVLTIGGAGDGAVATQAADTGTNLQRWALTRVGA